VIERVREVELGHKSPWGEQEEPLIRIALSPADAAEHLAARITMR
jgi:hypothetical protein